MKIRQLLNPFGLTIRPCLCMVKRAHARSTVRSWIIVDWSIGRKQPIVSLMVGALNTRQAFTPIGTATVMPESTSLMDGYTTPKNWTGKEHDHCHLHGTGNFDIGWLGRSAENGHSEFLLVHRTSAIV